MAMFMAVTHCLLVTEFKILYPEVVDKIVLHGSHSTKSRITCTISCVGNVTGFVHDELASTPCRCVKEESGQTCPSSMGTEIHSYRYICVYGLYAENFGDPCTSHTQCHGLMTSCYKRKCLCYPGYHYNPADNTCFRMVLACHVSSMQNPQTPTLPNSVQPDPSQTSMGGAVFRGLVARMAGSNQVPPFSPQFAIPSGAAGSFLPQPGQRNPQMMPPRGRPSPFMPRNPQFSPFSGRPIPGAGQPVPFNSGPGGRSIPSQGPFGRPFPAPFGRPNQGPSGPQNPGAGGPPEQGPGGPPTGFPRQPPFNPFQRRFPPRFPQGGQFPPQMGPFQGGNPFPPRGLFRPPFQGGRQFPPQGPFRPFRPPFGRPPFPPRFSQRPPPPQPQPPSQQNPQPDPTNPQSTGSSSLNVELAEAVAARLASMSPAAKTALINRAVMYFLDNNPGSQPQTQPPQAAASPP